MRIDHFLENIDDFDNQIKVVIRRKNADGSFTIVAVFKGCDEAYVSYTGTEEVKDFNLNITTKHLRITI